MRHKFWTVLLIALWGIPLWSQSSNPFEIRVKRRTKAVEAPVREATSSQSSRPLPEATKQKALSSPSAKHNPFEKHRFEVPARAVDRGAPAIEASPRPRAPRVNTDPVGTSVNYLFWVLVFLLLLLSILINLDRSVPRRIYRAVTNESYLNSWALTAHPQSHLAVQLYDIFFLLNMGVFVYLAGRTWLHIEGLMWLVKSMGLVFGVYGVYLGAMMLFRWVYPVEKEMTLYLFNIRIFDSAMGWVIHLLNFVIAFTPSEVSVLFIKVGIGILVLFYLMRIARGLFLSYGFLLNDTFHFILYLCAFEIAPFLIMYQWVVRMKIS